MSIRLIIDCGTTNLRVTVLNEDGSIAAQAKRAGGVRHTAIDGHNGRLKAMLKEAITEALTIAGKTTEDVTSCTAYGMITSNVGLLEIPHRIAPASPDDLRAGMKTALFEDIAPFPISFIPGVRNFGGKVDTDNFSGMDMMRGEETETIGLWQLLRPENESVFILPGSHNKFVRVDSEGHILGCMTSISGELLDAVTHHTILADAVERSFATADDYDAEMARNGAMECIRSGLGRAAFAGRILNQLGGEPSVKLRSYLLGAVLAQDILALRSFMNGSAAQIFIAGKQPLQQAIADVMEVMDMGQAVQVPAELSAQMGVTGAVSIAAG